MYGFSCQFLPGSIMRRKKVDLLKHFKMERLNEKVKPFEENDKKQPCFYATMSRFEAKAPHLKL